MLLFDENGQTQPISVTDQWAKWDTELANYGNNNGTAKSSDSYSWNTTPYSATSTQSTPSYSGGGSGLKGGSLTTQAGYQYIAPQLTGSTSTTSYSGGGALPTMQTASMTAPTYNIPEYDYGRINYLAQQQAAPLYSKARNALNTGIGKIASTDNPYMQSQARKQLMQGYGSGISEIAAGAARTGSELYAPEYAGQMQKATSEYGGQLTTAQANMQAQQQTYAAEFQAALADWQKSLVQTTTTQNTYTEPSSFNIYSGTTGSTSGDTANTRTAWDNMFYHDTTPTYQYVYKPGYGRLSR